MEEVRSASALSEALLRDPQNATFYHNSVLIKQHKVINSKTTAKQAPISFQDINCHTYVFEKKAQPLQRRVG